MRFDAVFYADDTILFSTKPRGVNELLKHIKDCSENHGLRINRAKCQSIHMNRGANIHFRDETPLVKAEEATYLGNNLNHTVDLRREVSQQIQDSRTQSAHGINFPCLGRILLQIYNGNSL